MSKDWKKEFDEINKAGGFTYHGINRTFDKVDFIAIKEWIDKHLSRATRERTQIFKEVREKVIGKYNFTSVSAPINNDKAVEAAFHRHLEISGENKLRKEQIKKLKELEEGK